eukprot:69057-Rhodomonas_salina.4
MMWRRVTLAPAAASWLLGVIMFGSVFDAALSANLKAPESPHFRDCITNKQPGTCGQANRTDATYDMVSEWDIGIIYHYLPDEAARAIREEIRQIPDTHWTQIDNKQYQNYGGKGVKRKPAVDMDYK